MKRKDKRLEQSRTWVQEHRDQVRDNQREWRSNHRERMREHTLRFCYGIGQAEYAAMLERQQHVCAICLCPEETVDRRTGKTKRLAVDHCHWTGLVRGLLCRRCNSALGMFRDSPQILRFATTYLERFESLIDLNAVNDGGLDVRDAA